MAEIEAETAGLRTREATPIDFSITVNSIGLILFGGLVFRLLLATLPGFDADMGAFQAWSRHLASHGPWQFYGEGFHVDGAPGYMYVLLVIGLADRVIGFSSGQWAYILKLPSIAADLGSAYLLYRLLEGQRPLFRLGAPVLYLAFPATFLMGAIWGQVDSLPAFFILLAVYYFSRNRPVAATLAFSIGFLAKPQAVAVAPLVAFWLIRHYPVETWVRACAVSLVVGLVVVAPYFADDPPGLFNQMKYATSVYPVDSFWAYNFWGSVGLGKLFKPDNLEFWGITYRWWGFILFGLATVLLLWTLRRSKGDNAGLLAFGMALSTLAFYLFLTRMHERYAFPFFLPFLAACALIQGRALWAALVGLAVIHTLNLYYVYSYYRLNFPSAEEGASQPVFRFLYDWVGGSMWGHPVAFWLSLLMTLAFPLLLAMGYLLAAREEAEPEPA